jgi:4-alpha-glucanotransferase
MQDVLHLGSEGRMNTPSAGAGNWTWRYSLHAVHPDFATKLAALMEMTDRDGYQKPAEGIEAGKPVEEASKRAEQGVNV